MIYQKLLDIAYQKYQTEWMSRHNFSLMDLIVSLNDYLKDYESENTPMTEDIIPQIFTEWQQNAGFAGQLWVCKEEFEQTEFQDNAYMKQILSPEEFHVWMALCEQETFDVILLEKPGNEGLDAIEIQRILKSLKTKTKDGNLQEYCPLEIYGQMAESSAMGFITNEAADSIGYDYTLLKNIIQPVIDDITNMTSDCHYKLTADEKTISIYFGTDLP